MLEGKELLEKAKLLSKKSEDEIAKGCGYVGPSGRVLRKSFYRALIEAKGYKIGNGRQVKMVIELQEEDRQNLKLKFMAMGTY